MKNVVAQFKRRDEKKGKNHSSSNIGDLINLITHESMRSKDYLKGELPFLIGHYTVVYLVAKPLTWSETEGDLVVIETSI